MESTFLIFASQEKRRNKAIGNIKENGKKGLSGCGNWIQPYSKKLLQDECQTILAEGRKSKLPKGGTDIMAIDKTVFLLLHFTISLFIILSVHSIIF